MLIARILRTLPNKWDLVRSALLIVWLRRCYPGLRVGRGVFVGRGTRIRVMNGARISIGDRTLIESHCHLLSQGDLLIGADGFLGAGCTLVAHDRIEIGTDALIAANVTIRDQDHRVASSTMPFRLQGFVTDPVTVGDNVWVGANAVVLKGVAIGGSTVVAAGAVVTRDLPARAVAAGVPARVIRMLDG